MTQTRLARARIHGGDPWALMRQSGATRGDILDCSVDVNPLGYPACVPETILGRLEEIQSYPDPEAKVLREALAGYHDVLPEQILVGNGSAELITLLAHLRPFPKSLVVAPAFTEYAWAMEQAGGALGYATTREADAFLPAWTQAEWETRLQDVDLAFLCNPNNPTGASLPREAVLQLGAWCRRTDTILVVDEAFVEFCDQPERVSAIPQHLALGNVVVLRSVTKFFAIPGLRLGYLIAPEHLVESLRAAQSPWPLNTFALAVGERLLSETAYMARSRATVGRLREALHQRLGAIPGLEPFPSSVNFILCKIHRSDLSSEAVCRQLRAGGILIRNCDSFTGLEPGRFIRLAVRTQAENDRLVSALSEVFGHAG